MKDTLYILIFQVLLLLGTVHECQSATMRTKRYTGLPFMMEYAPEGEYFQIINLGQLGGEKKNGDKSIIKSGDVVKLKRVPQQLVAFEEFYQRPPSYDVFSIASGADNLPYQGYPPNPYSSIFRSASPKRKGKEED